MRILISGGCKNGKSSRAQELALMMRRPDAPVYYIATMIPTDEEDLSRIALHRREREGLGFETIEAGVNLRRLIGRYDRRGVFLLDSVTALLANEMFGAEGAFTPGAGEKTAEDVEAFLRWTENAVAVSDHIYSGTPPYAGLTDAYLRGLACADRAAAGVCDTVIESFYGRDILYKGGEGHVGRLLGRISGEVNL